MRELSIAVVVAALALPSVAHAAATKEQCISAFDQGQRARREGHLRQSRESLLVCAQQECPAIVRADCSDVLRQVDAAVPSIVLRAEDASGKDLADVSVEANGTVLASSLDGRAILVDPGKISLVFKHPPWAPVTVDVTIAEAEKSRIVKATLGPPAPPPAPSPAHVAPPPPSERSTEGWIVPGALAAVSVAGFVIAGVTRLSVGNDADDAKKSCGPTCPESERAHFSSELVRANVFLGVGIGGVLAAAASWFVLAPKQRSAATTALLEGAARW